MGEELQVPYPPVWVYRLRLPFPQPIMFEDIVRQIDATSRATLQRITEVRSLYASSVLADIPASALQNAETYHPHLLGVLQSLENISPDMVKRVQVQWTLPLNPVERVQVPSLRFDHAMVLVSLGLAHRARASELLRACDKDVNSPDYKSASAELSTAAGVFEYCSKQPLMAWGGSDGDKIVELNAALFHALLELSLMEAQAMAVRKGLIIKVGLGVMNKIISGVIDHADRCLQHLADVRRAFPSDIPGIATLRRYVVLFHACYTTLLFHRLGTGAIDDCAYGKCVCYGKQGTPSPEVKKLLTDSKTASEMPSFLALSKEVFDVCEKIFASWEKDNSNIYYERVPPASENPPPPPAYLSKVTPYAEPYAVPPQISFQPSACVVM